MTSLFGSRRRAEAFAARADEATTGAWAPVDGATPDAETAALLELVGALRDMGASDDLSAPGDAFSLDLRERLVTEASTVLVAQRRRADSVPRPRRAAASTTAGSATQGRAGRRRRFATATATVAILMGGTAGMASAAQDSLPGQALYPVKRSLEKAAVTFSGSTVGRGRELLTQASGRLEEVQGLVDAGPAERTQIPGTLDTFNEQAREGAGLLISSYESTDDETAMATLREFAADSMDTIEELASSAPHQTLTAQALDGLGSAAVLMQQVDTAADQVCPSCSDLPALPTSDVLALTNASGIVGFPGVDATVGQVDGASTLLSAGTLAPLAPGLPAGQDILGVPGAPAPAGPDGATGGTPDSGSSAPAGGDTPGGSDPGTGPAPGGETPGSGGSEPSPPPDNPTPTPTDPTTAAPEPTPTEAPTPSETPTPEPSFTPDPSPSSTPVENPDSEEPPGDGDGTTAQPSAGDSGQPIATQP